MPTVIALNGNKTLIEQAVERLRMGILSGELAPNAKLRIQSLSQQFGLSATPVREALTRLGSHGLVEAIDQKGFRVVPISLQDFLDIQRLRHMVECEALRLAIERGDLEWESRIVAALHRLSSFEMDAAGRLPEGRQDFDFQHKQFHTALLSACGSSRLLALHADLHDQIYRYRTILKLVPRRKEGTAYDHQALARLTIARDTKGAIDALHRHIDLTQMASHDLLPEQWRQALAGPRAELAAAG